MGALAAVLAAAVVGAAPAPAGEGPIAFLTNRDGNDELYLMQPDGSSQTPITRHPAFDTEPSISPDGHRIAFTSDRDGNLELYVADIDGSNVVRVTDYAGADVSPMWSPNGKRLAFVRERPEGTDVYLLRGDGSKLNLTHSAGDDHTPAWSPDGQRIAFASSRDGNPEIYVMAADGSGPTNLTHTPEIDVQPSWSPDGGRIVFDGCCADHVPQIYVMNSDGSSRRALTTLIQGGTNPSWSPAGERIAFETIRDGNVELYAMNADGSGQTNLSRHDAFDALPHWGRSPSGRPRDRAPFPPAQPEPAPEAVGGGGVNEPDTRSIRKLLGPGSTNETHTRWNVWGADLGSMFEHQGRVFMVFGDTYGQPQESDLQPQIPPPDPQTQENLGTTARLDHRSNTAAFFPAGFNQASGPDFEGMIEDRPGHAKELLSSKKIRGDEQTVIPNHGIAVGDRFYLQYMSVSRFDTYANHAGLGYSDDRGQTWTKDPNATWPRDSGFIQVAFEAVGDYVYMLGVPFYRNGPVRLARVQRRAMLEPRRYRYWTGTRWSAEGEEEARPVVPGPVGELSVRWNSHYRKWILLYTDGVSRPIGLRTSECLTGPWSPQRTVPVSATLLPYAPALPPVGNDSRDIWFALSHYENYSVWWWHTSLVGEDPGDGPERCVSP